MDTTLRCWGSVLTHFPDIRGHPESPVNVSTRFGHSPYFPTIQFHFFVTFWRGNGKSLKVFKTIIIKGSTNCICYQKNQLQKKKSEILLNWISWTGGKYPIPAIRDSGQTLNQRIKSYTFKLPSCWSSDWKSLISIRSISRKHNFLLCKDHLTTKKANRWKTSILVKSRNVLFNTPFH